MTLKNIQKDLQNHKKQMAIKYELNKGAAYDTMYSEAWISKIMQGYPAVEKELQRILNR